MKVPAQTVRIGTALELVTERGEERVLWDEVHGWHVLTTPGAFEQAPGRARVFLVPGKLTKTDTAIPARGSDAFERWHKRAADKVGELDVPDDFPDYVGLAVRLDYASDKWRGKGRFVEYTHSFVDDGEPPRVYSAPPRRGAVPRGFALSGGSMAITEGGIA